MVIDSENSMTVKWNGYLNFCDEPTVIITSTSERSLRWTFSDPMSTYNQFMLNKFIYLSFSDRD